MTRSKTGYHQESPSLRHGLVDEAIWLGRLLHRASDEHAETAGLLALMLHVEARRDARRGPNGEYVPLEQQETTRWDAALIDEAERLLSAAARRASLGRFQLEAAIQSAHAHRRISGRTDWVAVEAMYRRLLDFADTVGGRVAHLAAVAEAMDPETAYIGLRSLPMTSAHMVQSYWALRAHLEQVTGRNPQPSLDRAIALSDDERVRAFLRRMKKP